MNLSTEMTDGQNTLPELRVQLNFHDSSFGFLCLLIKNILKCPSRSSTICLYTSAC